MEGCGWSVLRGVMGESCSGGGSKWVGLCEEVERNDLGRGIAGSGFSMRREEGSSSTSSPIHRRCCTNQTATGFRVVRSNKLRLAYAESPQSLEYCGMGIV